MKVLSALILASAAILISVPTQISAVNEANWFSKSLDNYALGNCSFFIRSSIIGDFQACLSKPTPKNETADDDATTDANSVTTESADDDEPQVTDADWPLSLCPSTQKVIDCFPTILSHDCLLPNERQFFETTKDIFQAQHDYACAEGERVALIVQNSTSCAMKTEQNQETRCFSMTTNKYRWLGWKLNYNDGQMCKYLLDLKLCEVKGYSDCPPEVTAFMNAYWDAGLGVPKCPTEKAPRGTTKNPWDGFIDNDYNWNADGMQDSNYNPWKGKIGKRSISEVTTSYDELSTTEPSKDKSAGSDKWTKMGSNFNYKKFMGKNEQKSGKDSNSFDWQKFMKM